MSRFIEHAYGFSFEPLTGQKKIEITDYRGDVIMLVNTASKCRFASQYAQLESLYQRYKDKGLVVIGIPSNDYFWREPLNHEQIAQFCEINYNITFPLTAKTRTRGMGLHPFYKWAGHQVGVFGSPKWNFHKYLLNRDAILVDFFHCFTDPLSPKVIQAVERQLAYSAKTSIAK